MISRGAGGGGRFAKSDYLRFFRKGRRLCIGILHQELPASAGGGTKLPRNRSVVDPPIYLFAAQTRRCSSARTLSTSRSSAVVSAAVTLTLSPTDGQHRLNTRQCTFSRLSSAQLAPHTDSTPIHSVGHEIIGTVVRAGANTTHRIGDRVGVGAQAFCCDKCDFCKRGLESQCAQGMIGTYQGPVLQENGQTAISQGGYADYTRVQGKLAVKLPDHLDSATAAPLLCAGVTVYAPLRRFGCGPGKKVGIIGIGGLGHLGQSRFRFGLLLAPCVRLFLRTTR